MAPPPLAGAAVLAGMSNASQCQKPLPVGASGSNTLSAKLMVPAGAPLQLSRGDTLPPVQPNELNTCSLANVPPAGTSALVSVKPAIVGTSGCVVVPGVPRP